MVKCCNVFCPDQGKAGGSNWLWVRHSKEQDSAAEWSAARNASLSARWCVGQFTCHVLHWVFCFVRNLSAFSSLFCYIPQFPRFILRIDTSPQLIKLGNLGRNLCVMTEAYTISDGKNICCMFMYLKISDPLDYLGSFMACDSKFFLFLLPIVWFTVQADMLTPWPENPALWTFMTRISQLLHVRPAAWNSLPTAVGESRHPHHPTVSVAILRLNCVALTSTSYENWVKTNYPILNWTVFCG